MSYMGTILIGLFGGLMSGLLGLGGGVVFVPLLIMIKGLDPHLAIGTSLFIIVPTVLCGILIHGKAGMVDWKTGLVIGLCAILGAWIGSRISLKLDVLILKRIFAFVLIAVAIKLFFQR